MTDQSTIDNTDDIDVSNMRVTLRNDTASYLTSFNPEEFYSARKDQIDDLFNQFAAIVGEDPKTPARTVGLLSYLIYSRTKESLDLTTSIALLAGTHASFQAGRNHNGLLRLAYVMQELSEDRTPYAGLEAANEDEALFNEGLRQQSGIRVVSAIEGADEEIGTGSGGIDGGTTLVEGEAAIG